MPEGTINPQHDYVAGLAPDGESRWPILSTACSDAVAVQRLLQEQLRRFTSVDVDIVVFGSLARREWTSGSDVDWTMLIDGQADSGHRSTAREVENTLQTLSYKGTPLKGPGAEGIFGNMGFSHDIVHHIGGQADTNRNTTQRILLLLEAVALREENDAGGGPFERIARQILNRYLVSDSNFHSHTDNYSRIPRFLLNDVVRYWRTMCVDFAYKDWEQAGKKWAVRNLKLRTSRKLLFVSGVFTVFSCFQNGVLQRDSAGDGDYLLKLQRHLLNFVHSTPLNILAWALQSIGQQASCKELFDVYEQFLLVMNDQESRSHLADLGEKDVYDDALFLKCREISHALQAVLKRICFEVDSPLRAFTFEYGVF